MPKRVRALSVNAPMYRRYKKAKATPKITPPGSHAAQGRARYQKAKLTYAETYNLNPGAGTAAVQVFAANGLFDPDITGVGHQPAGFDQYMALYNNYVVTKAWIKACFFNRDSSASAICGITPLDAPGTSTDFRQYIEQGTSKWDTLTNAGFDHSHTVLTHEIDMRKMATQDIFNDDTFSGTSAGNPGNANFFHVWFVGEGASDLSSCTVTVEIQYEVYFRDGSFTNLS